MRHKLLHLNALPYLENIQDMDLLLTLVLSQKQQHSIVPSVPLQERGKSKRIKKENVDPTASIEFL